MIPDWMQHLATHAPNAQLSSMTLRGEPSSDPRHAAVLIVIGPRDEHGEVIVIERAQGPDPHSGQIAFPGGQVETADTSMVETALREAHEEVGLDPQSVTVIAELPRLWLPPSGFFVTPILAWWNSPHELQVNDVDEVHAVHRIALTQIIDPENRGQVQAGNGYVGPAFILESMTVWGFTGALLSEIVDLAGWAVPWDTSRVYSLDSL